MAAPRGSSAAVGAVRIVGRRFRGLVCKGPGREARLSFADHATIENRNGWRILFKVHPAVGTPEFQVAVEQSMELRNRGCKPKSHCSDKGYHTAEFVTGMR